MADVWMDVDTALGEVPVNIMPLLDATDFKTIEDAVVFNQSGLALFWNFVTTAGVQTCTAVTPTSSGDYDWTDQGTSGMYAIEIPASGGASINNDTEGFGWFTGMATGVLPWRGPVIGFRAAALNNSLIDAGTTGLLAPTTADRTLDVSAGGEAGLDWANIGSPTTVQNLSGTNIDVDQVVASVSGAVGSVTGAVGSVTGNVGGNVTGTVGSVVGNVGGNVVGSVGSVVGAVGSVTGAVGSVTGNVGGNVVGSVGAIGTGGISTLSFAVGAIDEAAVSQGFLDAVTVTVLAFDWDGFAGEADRSVLNALRFLRNKWTIAAGTLIVTKENDTTSAWTGAVTQTAGNPVSAIDPA